MSVVDNASQQCVNHTALVLQGTFSQARFHSLLDVPVLRAHVVNGDLRHRCRCSQQGSPLTQRLLSANLPWNFLDRLLAATFTASRDSFERVFQPIVFDLVRVVRNCALDSDEFKQPLEALLVLCELKAGSTRPVCRLMTQQRNWIPATITEAVGKEVQKLSLLGPFLAASTFAEDTVSSHTATLMYTGSSLVVALPYISVCL